MHPDAGEHLELLRLAVPIHIEMLFGSLLGKEQESTNPIAFLKGTSHVATAAFRTQGDSREKLSDYSQETGTRRDSTGGWVPDPRGPAVPAAGSESCTFLQGLLRPNITE